MTRTIVLLLTSFSLTGCAGLGVQSDCPGPPALRVNIHYGDSEIRVDPPLRVVHRGGVFVLKLAPNTPQTYGDVKVTVVGKTASDQTLIDSRMHTYKSLKDKNYKIEYCIPDNQALGIYSYKVTVDTVGVIDPRVDVRN